MSSSVDGSQFGVGESPRPKANQVKSSTHSDPAFNTVGELAALDMDIECPGCPCRRVPVRDHEADRPIRQGLVAGEPLIPEGISREGFRALWDVCLYCGEQRLGLSDHCFSTAESKSVNFYFAYSIESALHTV